MHPNLALPNLPSTDVPSIITCTTEVALKNICNAGLLQSLWQTKNFLHLGSAGLDLIF